MKPRVAIFDLTSCDGCQVEILNLEDHLLDILGKIDLVNFRIGKEVKEPGPYDIAIVEGSVSKEEEIEKIKKIRDDSKILIALGTCATHGGLQSNIHFMDENEVKKAAYNDKHPQQTRDIKAEPLSKYVKVDYSIRGCPIDKWDFVKVLKQLLIGKLPKEDNNPVCVECRFNENVCQFEEKGKCLGPMTHGGCNAVCPSNNQPCDGCRGPLEDLNLKAGIRIMKENGVSDEEILKMVRKYTGVDELYNKIEELVKNGNN
ncbi:oxidoreductase [Candidatus Woesearchaeota archaeon]|nr:oxidoreductase [Candidatus Woesearchaeota archaeon]